MSLENKEPDCLAESGRPEFTIPATYRNPLLIDITGLLLHQVSEWVWGILLSLGRSCRETPSEKPIFLVFLTELLEIVIELPFNKYRGNTVHF